MASTDVQHQVSFEPSDSSTLDGILRHHLRLESQEINEGGEDQLMNTSIDAAKINPKVKKNAANLQTQSSISSGNKASNQFSRPTVHQSTLESDNKRRPIVLKRNSSRYKPPSPEPPDPNSEAKSVTIRRMQSNLAEWDKQLEEIHTKKLQNDSVQNSELKQRDEQIRELTEKLSHECEVRERTERERDDLATRLTNTEDELSSTKDQCEQLHADLTQYEAAYDEVNTQRLALEEELTSTNEQLVQSESMRRRLNDHVTELQGQLAIEEQRSRICVLM